jgi:hypothetical protein
MLSSAAQPCCHIGRFHRHGRDARATRKRPLGAGRRHQSCGRFAVISPAKSRQPCRTEPTRVCRPWPISAAVLSSRGVPLSANSGQRGLTGRLDFAKTSGGALRVFKLSLAGLIPRKSGSAFPPHRTRVPLAALIRTRLILPGGRPPKGLSMEARRPRMTWFDFRASFLSAIRSRGLAAKAILPRTFPSCRVADMPNTCSRTAQRRSDSPAPGACTRPQSAHGFSAPFQRRRASDSHRPIHLPDTVTASGVAGPSAF